MRRRLPDRQDIDRAIADAQNGSIGPYPLYEEYMDKLRRLADRTASYDPEELRQEGYALIDHYEATRARVRGTALSV